MHTVVNSPMANPGHESKVLGQTAPLPGQADQPDVWQGIGFSLQAPLDHHALVVPLNEIAEVLPVLPTIPLPNVQPWVTGVANLRGRVVPIISLDRFLMQEHSAESIDDEGHKLLLVKQQRLTVGLQVAAVHDTVTVPCAACADNNSSDLSNDLPPRLRPFITGCYEQNKRYKIFSTDALIADRTFFDVAKSH